jgi:AcrR family transcriptional regulator
MSVVAPQSQPTRSSILDAAEELFSRQGFSGTTTKEIGHASGTNPALLYYHFGSKEQLYRAVIERLADALVARGRESLSGARTPDQGIRGLVEAQAAFLREHPRAPALLIREMLDHDARHAEAFLPRVASQLFERVCALIEEGQRTGRFRTDLDPRFAAISTISQIVYFHLAKPAIRTLLGSADPRFPSPELQEEFARHAAEFAACAIASRGREGRTEGTT